MGATQHTGLQVSKYSGWINNERNFWMTLHTAWIEQAVEQSIMAVDKPF